ncbi:MAG: hypothetical protein KDD94_03795 [Calditrichaeota bacterium]|nr:hypothetical protein [Calditrichota bacterium]
MRNKLIVIVALLLTSCNIFSPFADESEFKKAQDAYGDGDFARSLEIVNNELKNDPLNSNLLYLRTKLNLQTFYEIDGEQGSLDLINLVNQFSELDSLATNNAPFYNTLIHPVTRKSLSGLSSAEKKRIDLLTKTNEIQKFNAILADLGKIYRQETHGSFNKAFIESDYALLLGMSGLVELRDTNYDGVVNNADYYFKLEVTIEDATLPLIPDSVILDSNLAETELDSLTDMLTFMKANNITLDDDTANFQPKTNPQHSIFFNDYLLPLISPKLSEFIESVEQIKQVFQSAISDEVGNEGKIYRGLNILQEIRNTEDDEDFQTLVKGLEDIDAALDEFDSKAVEKEVWDNYIKKELRAIPGLVFLFDSL